MVLTINVVCAQDLPDKMKNDYDIDRYNWSNFMIVEHNGNVVHVENDYIEPEDATFVRSLKWVAEMIEYAYELGKGDGESMQEI